MLRVLLALVFPFVDAALTHLFRPLSLPFSSSPITGVVCIPFPCCPYCLLLCFLLLLKKDWLFANTKIDFFSLNISIHPKDKPITIFFALLESPTFTFFSLYIHCTVPIWKKMEGRVFARELQALGETPFSLLGSLNGNWTLLHFLAFSHQGGHW